MQIPLQISEGRIILNALVSSSNFHKIGQVNFFLDTGSPESFFSKSDALRLQIPTNSLTFLPEPTRMGGYKYNMRHLGKTTFRVKNSDGKLESIILPQFAIAECTKKGEDAATEALSFPSIIGIDFLLNNKFILYIDVAGNEAYLKKKES